MPVCSSFQFAAPPATLLHRTGLNFIAMLAQGVETPGQKLELWLTAARTAILPAIADLTRVRLTANKHCSFRARLFVEFLFCFAEATCDTIREFVMFVMFPLSPLQLHAVSIRPPPSETSVAKTPLSSRPNSAASSKHSGSADMSKRTPKARPKPKQPNARTYFTVPSH